VLSEGREVGVCLVFSFGEEECGNGEVGGD
jgi:hypothetical protein